MSKTMASMMLALWLCGCASAGSDFAWDNARKITVGMPEAELVSIMGSPPTRIASSGNANSLTWVFASASPLQVGSRFVTFGVTNGKVSAVPDLSHY